MASMANIFSIFLFPSPEYPVCSSPCREATLAASRAPWPGYMLEGCSASKEQSWPLRPAASVHARVSW